MYVRARQACPPPPRVDRSSVTADKGNCVVHVRSRQTCPPPPRVDRSSVTADKGNCVVHVRGRLGTLRFVAVRLSCSVSVVCVCGRVHLFLWIAYSTGTKPLCSWRVVCNMSVELGVSLVKNSLSSVGSSLGRSLTLTGG